jgi:hypothetical protein
MCKYFDGDKDKIAWHLWRGVSGSVESRSTHLLSAPSQILCHQSRLLLHAAKSSIAQSKRSRMFSSPAKIFIEGFELHDPETTMNIPRTRSRSQVLATPTRMEFEWWKIFSWECFCVNSFPVFTHPLMVPISRLIQCYSSLSRSRNGSLTVWRCGREN